MNKKILILAVLAVFMVGMLCAYAVEPVDAKPIVKIKKHKTYYTAKFKYKGKPIKPNSRKTKRTVNCMAKRFMTQPKRKAGIISDCSIQSIRMTGVKKAGISAS
jgi:hypothetical protein